MKARLSRHRQRLAALRRRVRGLRVDVEFERAGGTSYYAVDFSEVHAYLHDDHGLVEHDEVGLGAEEPEKQALQRRLGLMHLFRSFGEGVYLLPPHLQELLFFVRTQQQRVEEGRSLRRAALRWSDRLDPRDRSLLEGLAAGAVIDKDDMRRLVDLVKGEFDQLCQSVDRFVTWYDRDHVLHRLRELVQSGRLRYHLEEIYPKGAAAAAASTEEEAQVFASFPEERRRKSRFAKHIDARALLYLRGANASLAVRKARLVLVTRDRGIREAAAQLEEDYTSWQGIRDELRGVELVLLDLILRGKTSADEKLEWLTETDELLERMEVAVDHILRSSERPGSPLAQSGERVLRDAWDRWYGHLNLRLSLAVPSVPWLREGFLPGGEGGEPPRAPQASTPTESVAIAEEQRLLRCLGTFIASARYRELANDTVDELWRDLLLEGMRMLFLGCLGERTEEVIDLFAERVEGKTGASATTKRSAPANPSVLLRSRRNATFGSLQFVSPQYREKMLVLRPWYTDEVQQFEQLRDAFYEVVSEATTGRAAPEDFLFMAFVLAMLDQWESARDLARRALTIGADSRDRQERRQPEVHYFLAVAERSIAANADAPELAGLVQAHLQIHLALDEGRAIHAGSSDVRYLKEQGTIALLIHQLCDERGLGQRELAEAGLVDLMDRDAAIALLERALDLTSRDHPSAGSGADRRLRVELLNNLAFIAISQRAMVSSELGRAEKYVALMDKEFEFARHDRPRTLPEQPWPALRDTQLMVRALGARLRADHEQIAHCLREYERLLDREDLPRGQRQTLAAHLELIRAWSRSSAPH